MVSVPKVLSEFEMDNTMITGTIQVNIVSRDIKRTLQGFVDLGIGPWRVYDYGPPGLQQTTFRGKPCVSSCWLVLAWTGTMMWESVEPREGPSTYKEYLEKNEEGIQHVAVQLRTSSIADITAAFAERGIPMIQSGVFHGIPHAYFDTKDKIGTLFEVFEIPEGAELPEPTYWFPEAPR